MAYAYPGMAYICQYAFKKYHVISDEGVYNLGLVLLFRYGSCMSNHTLKTLNNCYVISDEGVYKLGLV